MFLCRELDEFGACVEWIAQAGPLPDLSVPDALALSSVAFGVWGIAWGVNLVVNSILNKW